MEAPAQRAQEAPLMPGAATWGPEGLRTAKVPPTARGMPSIPALAAVRLGLRRHEHAAAAE